MTWLVFFTRYAGWSFLILSLTSYYIINTDALFVLLSAITIFIFYDFLFRKQNNNDNQNTQRSILARQFERIFLGTYLLVMILLLLDIVLKDSKLYHEAFALFGPLFSLFFIAYNIILFGYLLFSIFYANRPILLKCIDLISCILLCIFHLIIMYFGHGILQFLTAISIAYGSLFIVIGYTHPLHQKKQTSEEANVIAQ